MGTRRAERSKEALPRAAPPRDRAARAARAAGAAARRALGGGGEDTCTRYPKRTAKRTEPDRPNRRDAPARRRGAHHCDSDETAFLVLVAIATVRVSTDRRAPAALGATFTPDMEDSMVARGGGA